MQTQAIPNTTQNGVLFRVRTLVSERSSTSAASRELESAYDCFFLRLDVSHNTDSPNTDSPCTPQHTDTGFQFWNGANRRVV